MTRGTDEPVAVVGEPRRVRAALSPIRQRILRELAAPDSAAGLARRLGLSRQKVNYHLRELEKGGFVELAEERKRRGCTERILRVTARAFVVDPQILGRAPAGARERDRFSSAWLVRVAADLLRDVAVLRERARAAGKRLLTASLEADVELASRADFHAFHSELAVLVGELANRYRRKGGSRRRRYRLSLGLRPVITKTEQEARAEAEESRGRGKPRGGT